MDGQEGSEEIALSMLEDGGTLVLFPTIPQMSLDGEPCRILADAFGIEEFDEKHGWQKC